MVDKRPRAAAGEDEKMLQLTRMFKCLKTVFQEESKAVGFMQIGVAWQSAISAAR